MQDKEMHEVSRENSEEITPDTIDINISYKEEETENFHTYEVKDNFGIYTMKQIALCRELSSLISLEKNCSEKLDTLTNIVDSKFDFNNYYLNKINNNMNCVIVFFKYGYIF